MPAAHLASIETLCRETRQMNKLCQNHTSSPGFLEEFLAARITSEGSCWGICGGVLLTQKPPGLSIGGQGIQKHRERDKVSLSDFTESCQVACLPCPPSKRSRPTLASLWSPLPAAGLRVASPSQPCKASGTTDVCFSLQHRFCL